MRRTSGSPRTRTWASRPASAGFARKLLEPTLALTAFSLVLYYAGYAYYAGFHGRLGIPPYAVELGNTTYVRQGFLLAAPLLLFGGVAYMLNLLPSQRGGGPLVRKLRRLVLPVAVLAVLLLAAARGSERGTVVGPWTLPFECGRCVLAAGLLVAMVLLAYFQGMTMDRMGADPVARRYLAFPLVGLGLLLVAVAPQEVGAGDARDLLRGEASADVREVTVYMEDASHPIHAKCMHLVLDADGALYLLPLDAEGGLANGVHAVQEGDVRLVFMGCHL
ncbi:MAG TPA: hypothetical protein VNX21_01280 [Candidatus Thermoplasmatota archaeon]|nr:hypothetical protein [Candidatus Thermoplasmatota archaeon]